MSADRDAGQVRLTGEDYYREHGWSGCDGSSWDRLFDATRDGWEHAARLSVRLAEVTQQRDVSERAHASAAHRADDEKNRADATEAALAARQSDPDATEREALAKAWDEGYRAASHPDSSATPNPYRRTVTTGEWTEVGE